jgi:hypothetical protein
VSGRHGSGGLDTHERAEMLVEGPIGTEDSLPYGTADVEGSEASRLLKEFDYVEEEFFVTGTANVYGPPSFRVLEAGESVADLEPLSTVRQPDVPYTTRALVVRPRTAAQFSGVVHAIAFHNFGGMSAVEPDLLRQGAAWVGVEVTDGVRMGREVSPSGGIAHLRRSDPDRYGDLSVTGGDPEEWGLTTDVLATAFETLQIHEDTAETRLMLQEFCRSYGHGPDILLDVAKNMKLGMDSVLPGFDVRRVYTSGNSAGTHLPHSIITDRHHDRNMLPDGRPPIDGYMIMVGTLPATMRPRGAVLVGIQSEAEVMRDLNHWGARPPEDTDDPQFRLYEIAGVGHMLSAPRGGDMAAQLSRTAEQIPAGIRGLSERDTSTDYEVYDKFNEPIFWALWAAMYRWVDEGVPVPCADRILRDPGMPDGLARDEHGNVLGGLRLPWVDVPDATYIAKVSADDPNLSGMVRFTDEKMLALYGDGHGYEHRLNARFDELVEQRLLLPEDRDRMYRPAPHL